MNDQERKAKEQMVNLKKAIDYASENLSGEPEAVVVAAIRQRIGMDADDKFREYARLISRGHKVTVKLNFDPAELEA